MVECNAVFNEMWINFTSCLNTVKDTNFVHKFVD